MVEAARREGYDVSARLVTDWAALGLIDHPQRTNRAKGGGRGAHYVWSDSQCALFLTLLKHRRDHRSVASLAVVPVWTWLYWGDGWISLGQTRRALKTWVGAVGPVRSYKRAEANAKAVVDAMVGKGASRSLRLALQRHLAEGIHFGHDRFDRDEIEQLVKALVEGNGRYGPARFEPGVVVDTFEAQIIAIPLLDDLPDGAFYEARARQRQAMLEYVREQPNLAANPTFGAQFEDPNVEFLVQRSCHHLLLNLGGRLLAEKRQHELPAVDLSTSWQRPPSELLRLPDRN